MASVPQNALNWLYSVLTKVWIIEALLNVV